MRKKGDHDCEVSVTEYGYPRSLLLTPSCTLGPSHVGVFPVISISYLYLQEVSLAEEYQVEQLAGLCEFLAEN